MIFDRRQTHFNKQALKDLKDNAKKSWHRWFAWYPVQVDSREKDSHVWVFWEWVERHFWYYSHYRPEYRLVYDYALGSRGESPRLITKETQDMYDL